MSSNGNDRGHSPATDPVTFPFEPYTGEISTSRSSIDALVWPVSIRLATLPLFKRNPSNDSIEVTNPSNDSIEVTNTANDSIEVTNTADTDADADKRPTDAEIRRINHEARIARFKEEFEAGFVTTEDDTDNERTFTKEERRARREHNRRRSSQSRTEIIDWTKSILAESGSWEDVWGFHRCHSNPTFWRDESRSFLPSPQAANPSRLENVSRAQARQSSGVTDVSDMEMEMDTTDTDSDNRRSKQSRKRVRFKEGTEQEKESSEAWVERMVRRKQRCERNRRRRGSQARLGQQRLSSVGGDVSGEESLAVASTSRHGGKLPVGDLGEGERG